MDCKFIGKFSFFSSGRILYEKRQALDSIELLKMLANRNGIIIENQPTRIEFHQQQNENQQDKQL
jgi:hypothetical protein